MNDVGGIRQGRFFIGRCSYGAWQGNVGHVARMAMIFVNFRGHVVGADEERGRNAFAGDDGGEGEAEVSSAHDGDADGVGGRGGCFHGK